MSCGAASPPTRRLADPRRGPAEVSTFFTRTMNASPWPCWRARSCAAGSAPSKLGHAWELHPIVVDPDHERRGFGRLLIETLEAEARADGILTIHLGSDDDYGGTSLFGADLSSDALERLAAIEPRGAGHPVFFYLKLGYQLTGVLPDANGPGKPDIYLAKTL